MSGCICGDDRFEIIEKAKKAILEGTNIESSPEEMAVLDNFLYRCWQMGWLIKYEEQEKMKLNDTINLMESDNYIDRFKAEYYQLEIRYDKLGEMLKKYEKNELDFKLKCSYSLLLNQYKVMGDYLALLRLRAGIEEIRLEE